MRFVCRLRSIRALDIVENTDFKVIWLRKRRYYSHLIRFEISKNIEMSRDGSDLMQRVKKSKVFFADLSPIGP